MQKKKPQIRLQNWESLALWLTEHKQPSFRANQIEEWLWKKHVDSFEEMTNLPKSLRDLLQESFAFDKVTIHTKQVSEDGTIKLAFRLIDGNICEGVLIPSKSRMTGCISSQVGCSLACAFCATGTMDRLRNISYPEIYDQVLLLHKEAMRHYNLPLSNVVFMGMGEPLLNYKDVLASIRWMSSEKGFHFSPRRVTVSTAGIAKMIDKLSDDQVRFPLALSLHAATNEKRSKIMEINDTNSLEVLKQSLIRFHEETGNDITLEYVLFKDFNDGPEDAMALHYFAQSFPCKINIIEYNPVEGKEFQGPNPEVSDAFVFSLQKKGHVVNIRRSRGKDIDAACGQLANKSSQ